MKEIMTIDEVAEYLQLHPQTVYKLVRENKLPHYRVGKQYRFTKVAIDKTLSLGEFGRAF